MPHRPAALKSLRQNRTKNLRNKRIKSRLRTEQNKLDRMIERRDVEGARQQVSLLTKLYQQAAAKRILHPNRAAHKQAQFQKRLNETLAQPS
jgi:small subunit ribosomal protein S20